jgi:hypothetical protein
MAPVTLEQIKLLAIEVPAFSNAVIHLIFLKHIQHSMGIEVVIRMKPLQ